ncbi:MAG: 50S ribosomal protein L6 [Oligoflexia bacterium]|nr:50S ribosomal protein L6 [Oligoflexia bacterium]
MSRIGKMPIPVPSGVNVDIKGSLITVAGPRGTLSLNIPVLTGVENSNGQLLVTRKNDERSARAQHGLTRALINNMVKGVSTGFKKELEIIGVGYRAQMRGKDMLGLYVGYSHPVEFFIPEGIKASVDQKTNVITLEGCDKGLLGEVAAQIRKVRSPEPYKGKGIRYTGEVVKRKVGKAVVGGK